MDEDRWHPIRGGTVLPDLSVQLPRVGTAGPTGRKSQLARIDFLDRLVHSIQCTPRKHEPQAGFAGVADAARAPVERRRRDRQKPLRFEDFASPLNGRG